MTATSDDPNLNPKVQAARLEYLKAQAAFDTHIANARAANGGIDVDADSEAGIEGQWLERQADWAYEAYDAAWTEALADTTEPEPEAEAEI